MKTVKVVIHGRVQGVWFRATTKSQAEKQGVHGWVRNTDDGKVEAVFQGDDEVVDGMVDWCHQGSSLSKVAKIESTVIDTDEIFDDFHVRYH